MSANHLFRACILICIAYIFQPVYGLNPLPDHDAARPKTTCIISSDREGRTRISEALSRETIYLTYAGFRSSKGDTIYLFVNDTRIPECCQVIDSSRNSDTSRFTVALTLLARYMALPKDGDTMVSWGFGKKTPDFRSEKFKVIYQPFSLITLKKGDKMEVKPGDQVLVRSAWPGLTDQMVFLNDFPVPIASLVNLPTPEKNNYYFILNKKVANDSLVNLFNQAGHGRVVVKISIGKTFDTRKETDVPMVIVFDSCKDYRQWTSLIILLIVIIIVQRIIAKNKLQVLRDASTAIQDPPFSLAKTQMAFWTIIILLAYFYIWFQTGALIHITPQVLILLGISAGSYFSANIIDNNDIANPLITSRHQDSNQSKSFLMNILSDKDGVSIHRFQNVAFTIAIGGYFLFEVYAYKTIPELDSNLIVLMGISSATYIAVKQGENKPANPAG